VPRNLFFLLGILFFLSACTTKFKDVDADQGEDVDAPDDGDTSEGEAECGNGTREPGEECDDGNTEDGDGCRHDCTLPCEDSGDCADGDVCNGEETCNPGDGTCSEGTPLGNGFVCRLDPRSICLEAACVESVCGDRFVDEAGGEFCDPPGEGNCLEGCQLGCGREEECPDDENICNGDEFCAMDAGVCDRTEAPADGFDCGVSPRQICLGGSCQESRCGDSFPDRYAEQPEECDDGNDEIGDGCDNDCTFSCHGNDECDDHAICNGIETCDTSGSHTCLAGANEAYGTRCEDDGLDCTGSECDGSGVCYHPINCECCLIGGQCYGPGATEPGNPCRVCDPDTLQTDWTTLPDDSPCEDGNLCTENHCISGTCASATITVLRGVDQVALGSSHACALMIDRRTIKCWGANWIGQFGNGSTTGSYYPANGPDLGQPVRMIAAGAYHTCALLEDSTVRCWGHNNDGELGDGSGSDHSTVPVSPSGLTGVTYIGAGQDHTCAVTSGSNAYCWGKRENGQVGNLGGAGTTDVLTPQPVYDYLTSMNMTDAIAIAGGSNHTCAQVEIDRIRCWGLNASGQLGLGDTHQSDFPAYVLLSFPSPIHEDFFGLGAGSAHSCGLVPGSGAPYAVECWGANSEGQLGDETRIDRSLPVTVKDGGFFIASVSKLSAGYQHTCASTVDGHVKCWGSNNHGQLGIDAATASTASAVTVLLDSGGSQLTGVIQVAAGFDCTCAIVGPEKDLYCWGSDEDGKLGNSGPTADENYPSPVTCVP
jgi:cysteine-rich repeat protein